VVIKRALDVPLAESLADELGLRAANLDYQQPRHEFRVFEVWAHITNPMLASAFDDEELPLPEAPFGAGPPPLFDVTSFSKWVTDVFGDGADEKLLDKLAAMDASDDMAKMRLLLKEEVSVRRARFTETVAKSYEAPEQGAGSKDVMMIAFAGENNCLVRSGHTPPPVARISLALVCARAALRAGCLEAPASTARPSSRCARRVASNTR
jgi:hypothetical protein